MTREEMWKEFENQLKREAHTPITMSYDDSIRLAELGIKETVAKWKERLEQEPCEDTISRHEAKRIIFNEFEGWATDKEVAQLKRITKQFDDLPSVNPKEPKTGWIPVNERLPEKDGYYITSTFYGEVYCDYWNENRFERTETVIAWLPLPKPYKAEEEENEKTLEYTIPLNYCPVCGRKLT